METKDFPLTTLPDYPLPPVRLRRTVHLHLPHSWRASDLSAFQLHQDGSVCRRKTGMNKVTGLVLSQLTTGFSCTQKAVTVLVAPQ